MTKYLVSGPRAIAGYKPGSIFEDTGKIKTHTLEWLLKVELLEVVYELEEEEEVLTDG